MSKAQKFIDLLDGTKGMRDLKKARTLVDESMKYIKFIDLPSDIQHTLKKLGWKRDHLQIYLLHNYEGSGQDVYKVTNPELYAHHSGVGLERSQIKDIEKNKNFIKFDQEGESPYLLFKG